MLVAKAKVAPHYEEHLANMVFPLKWIDKQGKNRLKLQ